MGGFQDVLPFVRCPDNHGDVTEWLGLTLPELVTRCDELRPERMPDYVFEILLKNMGIAVHNKHAVERALNNRKCA
jgi:hypothetical protein